MTKVTVLILTKNEGSNIEECIKSCSFANEVIIIDSGSTDRTVELAKGLGAKVTFREWDNDFAAQRNYALCCATEGWVFYLDADERVTPKLAECICRIVDNNENDKCYCAVRKSVAFGKTFNYGVLKPDKVIRLFPTGHVKWVHKVHEKPESDLNVGQLDGYIEHYTYKTWEQWEIKFNQYTTIWADDAYKRGKKTSLVGIFAHSFVAFVKMFIFRTGFLDGLMGCYMCFNHFFYTLIKYLKLYERQGGK